MKVLIIGGTGNISTAISRQLIEQGVEVTLYNRGKTEINFPGDFKTIIGNRYDYQVFEKQMAEAGLYDCVVDMIGYDPEDVASLTRAFKGRTEQVIFCSTVDVYTKPAINYPVVEGVERQPSPAFSYAYKKAICEKILEEASQKSAFALTIIRPAHTYNDTQTPIPFIGSGLHFFKRIRQHKPIIILGDGTSFWASAHRDDVAPTFVAAVGNTGVYGKAYHVTAEEWMTWEHHYQTVADVMGTPPINFIHIPTDLLGLMAPKAAEWSVVNFHYNNIFDNSAAKSDLQYQYTISWREGVERMVAFHDARGDIDSCPDDILYNKLVSVWQKMSSNVVDEMRSLILHA
jgi:nucleoside-diphosphate-sugar epimerase